LFQQRQAFDASGINHDFAGCEDYDYFSVNSADASSNQQRLEVSIVPEPSSLLLIAPGLVATLPPRPRSPKSRCT